MRRGWAARSPAAAPGFGLKRRWRALSPGSTLITRAALRAGQLGTKHDPVISINAWVGSDDRYNCQVRSNFQLQEWPRDHPGWTARGLAPAFRFFTGGFCFHPIP